MGNRRYLLEDDEADAEAVAEASVAPEPPLPTQHPHLSPSNALLFQHAIGNAAVARLVHPEVDEKAGEGEFGGALVTEQEVSSDVVDASDELEEGEEAEEEEVAAPGQVALHGEHAHGSPDIGQGEENEFGELTGSLDTGVPVCLFIDGGKVGEGLVGWAGGTGGKGLQNVGDVELTAPEYEGSDANDQRPAKAWVKHGTGYVKVRRTFNGVRLGDNGIYYFTAGAVARADVHEKLHVDSSKAIHDAHLAPMEARVKQHKGRSQGLEKGKKKRHAIKALQDFVDWNETVKKFQTDDTAANTPMGTVDTQDMARPDFIQDYGEQSVNGVKWAHYIDIPPGPPAKVKKKRKKKHHKKSSRSKATTKTGGP